MKTLLRYWKTILVSGGILYASLIRVPHITLPPISHSDKWAHMVMYLILGAVWLWDLKRSEVQEKTSVLLAIAFPIIYGGLIEILQEKFFYPRTGDWKDWVADMIGTVAGVALTYGIWRLKKN